MTLEEMIEGLKAERAVLVARVAELDADRGRFALGEMTAEEFVAKYHPGRIAEKEGE